MSAPKRNANPFARFCVRSLKSVPGVGDAFANLYDSLLFYDPAVSANCSRVAVYEGRVIGHAFLAPREIRVCDGDFPDGLVGMVVVHPDYRGRGVGSGLIDDVRFPHGNKPPHTLIVHLRMGLWFDITQRIYSGSTNSNVITARDLGMIPERRAFHFVRENVMFFSGHGHPEQSYRH